MPPPLLLLQDISVTFEVTRPASGRGLRGFEQCSNAFRNCAAPKRLQELADSLTAEDLLSCGQRWLARFTPFFTERERKQAGCQHRLFFSQIEFCDNLLFHRRTSL